MMGESVAYMEADILLTVWLAHRSAQWPLPVTRWGECLLCSRSLHWLRELLKN